MHACMHANSFWNYTAESSHHACWPVSYFLLFRFEVLPIEDGDALKKELQANLLNEYDAEFAVKTREEFKINSKALAVLKVHEKRLTKPSPTQYYTSKLTPFTTLTETKFGGMEGGRQTACYHFTNKVDPPLSTPHFLII